MQFMLSPSPSSLTLGALNARRCTRLSLLVELGFESFVAERALAAASTTALATVQPLCVSLGEPAAAEADPSPLSSSVSDDSDDESQVLLPPLLVRSTEAAPEVRPPRFQSVKSAPDVPRARSPRLPKKKRHEEASSSHTGALKKSKSIPAVQESAFVDVRAETQRLFGSRDQATYDMFWQYVYERQMVWFRRARGDPEPWTQDTVLQTYFFCNTYRELDKGSRYFKDQVNLRRQRAGGSLPLAQVVFMAVAYRLINNVATFERYPGGGIPLSTEVAPFVTWLRREMEAKRQVFTGAHQNNGLRRYEKTVNTLVDTLDSYTQLLLQSETLEKCLANLRTLFGMGSFFAWQVACDLLELKALQFKDQNDFALIGPSAQMGLSCIYPLMERPPQPVLLNIVSEMYLSQESNFERLGLPFPKHEGSGLNLKNLEHSLCEFGKYARVVKGGGTSQKLRKRVRNELVVSVDGAVGVGGDEVM